MGPIEITLIVIGSVVLLLVLLALGMSLFFHKMMFNHRFELDPLQGVYTKEILDTLLTASYDDFAKFVGQYSFEEIQAMK